MTYEKPLVSLAASFFGTYGPMVRISNDVPILIVALTSVVVATLASTTLIANRGKCAADIPVTDACLVAALYAASKFFLTSAFGMIPVTVAQPVFFVWIPLVMVFESVYKKWVEPGINFIVTTKNKIASVLLLLGIATLIYADLPSKGGLLTYLSGIMWCLVAASATAMRIVVVKYRLQKASPQLQTTLQSWALGVAGCVLLMQRAYEGGAVLGGHKALLWICYSVGIYVAYIALYEGLQTQTATTTAASVSIELLVGAILGLIMLGEFKDTTQSNILGLNLPIHKVAGLMLVGSSFVVS
jgi:drug/metabolite transporter (DMT)-like permease